MNVDIPIALAIFILVVSFVLISYINFYRDVTRSSFAYQIKDSIMEDFFHDKSSDLYLLTNFCRINVNITETSGFQVINGLVVLNLTLDPECKLLARNTSIRVLYNNGFLPYNLSNLVYCSEDFLKSASISFPVNMSAYEEKTFQITFSSEELELPNSTYVVPLPKEMFSNEKTILPKKCFEVISYRKLDEIKNMSSEEMREKYGVEITFEVIPL